MKFTKILSIAGLMLVSTQQNATVVENNQIMPPPGPYKSIMSNTPPAFVPFGSQQAQTNPHQQNRTPSSFSRFPANNRALSAPLAQQPEWVLNKQQENKDKIDKMLKENEARNKENEKRFTEYLKNSNEEAIKRNNESKKWIAENNKKMKEFWESELEKIAKNQKKQIEKAKDLPDWVKKQMLEQQEKQLTFMKNNPPVPAKNNPDFSSFGQGSYGSNIPNRRIPESKYRGQNYGGQNYRGPNYSSPGFQGQPPQTNFNNPSQMPPASQMPRNMQRNMPSNVPGNMSGNAPGNMQFRQAQPSMSQQRPMMNQPSYPVNQNNMNRQYNQQPRQFPGVNRNPPMPVQQYPVLPNGQQNYNPYNRYQR